REPSIVTLTGTGEPYTGEELTRLIKDKQSELYHALPPVKFYTEEELDAEGVPVTLAGKRSHQWNAFAVGFPQQLREVRQKFQAAFDALIGKKPEEPKPSAFPVKAPSSTGQAPIVG